MFAPTCSRFLAGAPAAGRKKLQVAIVGSGPAGCYVAHHLLKMRSDVQIDIFEKLPVPFGLSRFGVAPDHPEVKNVEKTFRTMFEERRADVALLANTMVGDQGIPLELLQQHYSAVVLAHGASASRTIGIDGESELDQILPARRFVEWYNTYPEPYGSPSTPPFDLLAGRRVVIIGNGNVAVDCARVLGAPSTHFSPTDINSHTVQLLKQSTVEEIVVVGRRSVGHAAFTTKEFREISGLSAALEVLVEPFDLKDAISRSASVRGKKRQLELLHKHCSVPPPGSPSAFSLLQKPLESPTSFRTSEDVRRRIFFAFNLTPSRFVPHRTANGRVGGVEFQRPDGSHVYMPCDVVLTSVGYRTTCVHGAPFDSEKAVIPNIAGRVSTVPGLYAAGWAKTGPRGVIASTLQSSLETAAAIDTDFTRLVTAGATPTIEPPTAAAAKEGRSGLRDAFVQLGVQPLTYDHVRRIWQAEQLKGVTLGKAAEKTYSTADMIRIGARPTDPTSQI